MTDQSQQPTPAAVPPSASQTDQLKARINARFKVLGIDFVSGRLTRSGDAMLIQDLKPTPSAGVDLAMPEPFTAAGGDGAAPLVLATLAELIVAFVRAALAARPDPFLIDGEVTLHASDYIARPIDWAAKWAKEAAERKQALQAAKLPVIAALKAAGAAVATITYDGEGDSGQIESITAETADSREVNLDLPYESPESDSSASTLKGAIDQLAWGCLEACHEGFENNEGGYGEIVIDVADGTITVDHNERIITDDNTLTEL